MLSKLRVSACQELALCKSYFHVREGYAQDVSELVWVTVSVATRRHVWQVRLYVT